MQTLLDFDAGCSLRDAGIDMAGWGSLSFVECMRDAARAICARKGSVTTDDLRQVAMAAGLQPNSSHCWGAIWHEPGWHCIGSEHSKVVSNRARRILRWTWHPNAAVQGRRG